MTGYSQVRSPLQTHVWTNIPYARSSCSLSSRFFPSRALIRCRSVASMFCCEAHLRFCLAEPGLGYWFCARRELMIRPRNSCRLYIHAAETRASAATVRKLISQSGVSIRVSAAKVRCMTSSLRRRALRLRPSVFLSLCSSSQAILADTVGITMQGQLNMTAKFEAGLDEVRNSVGMNHALRNLRLVESSCGT
jgi:hypothetical protein